MRSGWLAVTVAVALATVGGSTAHAAPRARPVTVFLERDGRVVSDDVRIPRFGGGDRAWAGIVACVREHYAPFQVDVVDQQPARGEFITAVVGGRASQLGLDDRWTNGVGPHTGRVIPNAVVFIFSKVGTGERDINNLCAVTAHEVAHALGLDHSFKCGDIMSYWLDRCGKRRFMDVDAPCGEDEARVCADGKRTQSSYRRLGALVGFRSTPPVPDDEPVADPDVDEPDADGWEVDPWDADGRGDVESDGDVESWDAPFEPADPYPDDEAARDAPPQPSNGHRCGGGRMRRYVRDL